ncbi:hypothetical protein ASC80_02645 [Afipia sp. Root123D2]|uniref:glycosyltransferase n=1 Tax=Afipia sp. Root123D2 TaxID=1736436 RepID=UPI0006F4FA78|nr:glycosyltransferase family 1 protein [Afipia sp. Root123D2]KQW22311.1 hypothetical protein ASC80_02645 [Afipia sp. Root123D2]
MLKNMFQRALSMIAEDLRFGKVFWIGAFAIVRRSQLLQLYGRIAQLEWFAIREKESTQEFGTPVNADKRSVVFLHNSYYNFYYLARALRKRGWDAISVSVEDPNGPNANFYHGNDLSLYDPSPTQMRANIEHFFNESTRRFHMVHFYGKGHMSFFPSEFDSGDSSTRLPLDFLKLKQRGTKVGYSVCGCLDGVSQTTFNSWSVGCCDRCVWQNNPVVCNDRSNLAWGHKVAMFCDLISCEGFPALDYQSGPKAYREPLTTAIDPEIWNPNLAIPEQFRLAREEGELIVYHAVGNFELRASGGRNLKGTGAVVKAVDRLRSEGMNVRLEFRSNVPNIDVRYFQVQADVIVDQLNHGRYGATAREGMMLGRPTICHINKAERSPEDRLESIETCPLVSANEETVYDVLRDLLLDAERRRRIGIESRKFAMKWHSADSCAERFEQVYDRLMMGFPPASN